jgi:D-alanine-D-alanine ligase-like ATP-grasp enzyme
MTETDAHTTTDAPRHYPYVTRVLIELYKRGALPQVVSVAVEPEYGYATQITYVNGTTRMTYGNDLGLNTGAACDVVKDKAYTKYFLERSGVRCPNGRAFLMPCWAERIRDGLAFRQFTDMRLAGETLAFIDDHFGYPVYLKPVDGSKGAGVHRCDTSDQVRAALDGYAARRVRVALVEEAVPLPDYRLVVLHGELISAYRRTPLTVVGDGRATVLELAIALQHRFQLTGRDSVLDLDDRRIDACLKRAGLDRDAVPSTGRSVALHDISNLSTGGTAQDVTGSVANRWRALARDVVAGFGLCFAGVDLACSDIHRSDADYSVLEINAAPGLDHYAAVGARQQQIVHDLYAKVLNVAPSRG